MNARRAILVTSAEKYLLMMINLGSMAIIARLLTPAEFGVSVLGMTVIGLCEVTRDLGMTSYLIQSRDLTREQVHTAFTINLIMTVAMASVIFLLAPAIAGMYGVDGLTAYLRLTIVSFLLGPFVSPLFALLRRDLQFVSLSCISLVTTAIQSTTAIVLIFLGWSYLSFAWAILVSATAGMLLALWLRPDLRIYGLRLAEWRAFMSYGRYDCGADILNRIWDAAPYVLLGRLAGADAVGHYQRATTVSALPERLLLAALPGVALPMLAAKARRGESLRPTYLRSVALLTGLYWPALVMLALLAHPVVLILLGSQWLDTVPLVRIMAIAAMIWFPVGLTFPVLAALGAVRSYFITCLIIVPVSVLIFALAAPHGLLAAAASMLAIMAVKLAVSLSFTRRAIGFAWGELARTLAPSAGVACFTALGPLGVLLASGPRLDLSLAATAVAVGLGAIGFSIGLWTTRHELVVEVEQALAMLRRRWSARTIQSEQVTALATAAVEQSPVANRPVVRP